MIYKNHIIQNILIFFTILFNIINSQPLLNNGRITNGHEAESSQFPWQVSLIVNLNDNKTVECSGTLLSTNWVITSAQCLNNMKNITLGFGSIEWNHPKQTIISDTVYIYEEKTQYRIRPEIHDIALIKMNQSVNITTNKIKPILLPGADQIGLSFEGVKGITAGWGKSSEPHCNNTSEEDEINDINQDKNVTCLNWTEMNILGNDECRQIYGSIITDHKLCARWLSGSNICGNDFGGSLVILEPEGWKIIGVASYTQGCASIQPAIYSRITKYMQWISDTTGIKLEYY